MIVAVFNSCDYHSIKPSDFTIKRVTRNEHLIGLKIVAKVCVELGDSVEFQNEVYTRIQATTWGFPILERK